MSFHEKIKNNIHENKDDYIKFFQAIVKEPTITGNELGAQTLVAERLKEKGLEVDVWDPDYDELVKSEFFNPLRDNFEGSPNVVGVLKGTEDGRSLILN